MTTNKQKNRTGGSFEIIPERRSDGVAGPFRVVPGDASGAADDCDVNNHEPDSEIVDTAPQLIVRDASAPGVADACKKNNQQQDAEIVDTVPQLITRDASGAIDSGQLKNPEQEVKIKDTAPRLIERDASAPGVAAAREDNNYEQKKKTKDTTPRLVERATGLRGRSICSARVSKSTYRKRTERDLNFPDADVPYIKTEHAIRALVCSLMERQDRVTEAIFLKLNDLEYRVDDLELWEKARATKQPGTKKEVRK